MRGSWITTLFFALTSCSAPEVALKGGTASGKLALHEGHLEISHSYVRKVHGCFENGNTTLKFKENWCTFNIQAQDYFVVFLTTAAVPEETARYASGILGMLDDGKIQGWRLILGPDRKPVRLDLYETVESAQGTPIGISNMVVLPETLDITKDDAETMAGKISGDLDPSSERGDYQLVFEAPVLTPRSVLTENTASGSYTADGQTYTMGYAFAETQVNWVDKTKLDVKVFITDVEIPEAERTDRKKLATLRREGKLHGLRAEIRPDNLAVGLLGGTDHSGTTRFDALVLDRDSLEGRIHGNCSGCPAVLDVTFHVSLPKPAASD